VVHFVFVCVQDGCVLAPLSVLVFLPFASLSQGEIKPIYTISRQHTNAGFIPDVILAVQLVFDGFNDQASDS
jgi:hypothetical protein